MKRREVVKLLSVAPVAGGLIGTTTSALAGSVPAAAPARDLFKELGVKTFINASCLCTHLSGSLMTEDVLQTIKSTASEFANIDDVQDKVGEKIAALCHAEAATVTAGAWSALILGTAGILTGMDNKKVRQVPNLEGTGMKSEVIIQKGHSETFSKAVCQAGVKLVTVETAEDVAKAVNEKTAFMLFMNLMTLEGKIKHEEWLSLAKKYNLPTMIDIASDVPPVENIWKFNDMGFDLVTLSAGKAICGPQSAGILMGRKALIAAARLSASPRVGVGRGQKVNKEEILGTYVALKRYIHTDHDKEWKMWEDRLAVIDKAVKDIDGITTEVYAPEIADHLPNLNINWDESKVKITQAKLIEQLYNGNPAILVHSARRNKGIDIVSNMLKPRQDKIIAKRVREELLKVLA
jgi:uncharacterized pyridoxal phosphate-dependent enzyme